MPKMLALGVGHPHVQRPQVGHRHIGEGQVMQITVGTELRGQGADCIAALKLRSPDRLPVALVKHQFTFGSHMVLP